MIKIKRLVGGPKRMQIGKQTFLFDGASEVSADVEGNPILPETADRAAMFPNYYEVSGEGSGDDPERDKNKKSAGEKENEATTAETGGEKPTARTMPAVIPGKREPSAGNSREVI